MNEERINEERMNEIALSYLDYLLEHKDNDIKQSLSGLIKIPSCVAPIIGISQKEMIEFQKKHLDQKRMGEIAFSYLVLLVRCTSICTFIPKSEIEFKKISRTIGTSEEEFMRFLEKMIWRSL